MVEEQDVLLALPAAAATARSSGPRARSNGRRASSAASRARLRLAALRRQAGEVDDRQAAAAPAGAITWTGRPPPHGEGGAQRLVAADDLAEGRRRGPPASSRPARRTAAGML